jgi:uncharacterized NAD-dependent epimerase/dehydratase family protein
VSGAIVGGPVAVGNPVAAGDRPSPAFPEGAAVIYCEGSFRTTYGKTAHGLVRRSRRYRVLSVVDSTCAGQDAGTLLDLQPGIPIHTTIGRAVRAAREQKLPATHLVIGLAPDGGRLEARDRRAVLAAIELGLHVDSGLHDFLGEDPVIAARAVHRGVRLRDVRRTPPRSELHIFTGRIEQVRALKVAVLGTDSAVGKRTTAWALVDALEAAGRRAQLIGTGQTAWLQGAEYGIILDSLINDFVAGEIEHAVWRAWRETGAEVLVLEGQGSLMNPAYPGGFELLAAGRPEAVVLQHAPARRDYDGFPGYPIQPLERQIQAVELLSGRSVVAITVNHEGLEPEEVPAVCEALRRRTGLPVLDPLLEGAGPLAQIVEGMLPSARAAAAG